MSPKHEIKQVLSSPISPDEQNISISSSSLSSTSSSIDSNDDQTDIPPLMVSHAPPTNQSSTVIPPSHVSLSPHIGATIPQVSLDNYISSPSESPSSSSISSSSHLDTPPKLLEVSTATLSPHPPILFPPLTIPKHERSPISFQEEEDSSESDSSLESLVVPQPLIINQPRQFITGVDSNGRVPRLISKSPSPIQFIGPLTVSISKFTNTQLEFPDARDPNKIFVPVPNLVIDTNVSKSQNVDSIFLKETKKPPISKIDIHSSPQSSSLLVKINRHLLKPEKPSKQHSTATVKIAIPKLAPSGKAKGRNIADGDDDGTKRHGKGKRSRKRKLDQLEVVNEPKKVNYKFTFFYFFHCPYMTQHDILYLLLQ